MACPAGDEKGGRAQWRDWGAGGVRLRAQQVKAPRARHARRAGQHATRTKQTRDVGHATCDSSRYVATSCHVNSNIIFEMPLPDHEARLEISCHILILPKIHLVNLEPYHCEGFRMLRNRRAAKALVIRIRIVRSVGMTHL